MAWAVDQDGYHLDAELDDWVACMKCTWCGLVRMGTETCPECGEDCLVDT